MKKYICWHWAPIQINFIFHNEKIYMLIQLQTYSILILYFNTLNSLSKMYFKIIKFLSFIKYKIIYLLKSSESFFRESSEEKPSTHTHTKTLIHWLEWHFLYKLFSKIYFHFERKKCGSRVCVCTVCVCVLIVYVCVCVLIVYVCTWVGWCSPPA